MKLLAMVTTYQNTSHLIIKIIFMSHFSSITKYIPQLARVPRLPSPHLSYSSEQLQLVPEACKGYVGLRLPNLLAKLQAL